MADSTAQIHPADKFIEVKGLRLHYLDFGGDGRPLVCVHGLSGNAHNFDSIAPSLARRYHVISVERARARRQRVGSADRVST